MIKTYLFGVFWLGAALSWGMVWMVIDGSNYLMYLDDPIIYLGKSWAIVSIVAVLMTTFTSRWGTAIVLGGSVILVAMVNFDRSVTPVAVTLATAWIMLVVISGVLAILRRRFLPTQFVTGGTARSQTRAHGGRIEPGLGQAKSQSSAAAAHDDNWKLTARRGPIAPATPAFGGITAYEGVTAAERESIPDGRMGRLDADTLEPENFSHEDRKEQFGRNFGNVNPYASYDPATTEILGTVAWHAHHPIDSRT